MPLHQVMPRSPSRTLSIRRHLLSYHRLSADQISGYIWALTARSYSVQFGQQIRVEDARPAFAPAPPSRLASSTMLDAVSQSVGGTA
jgi:hypothetical protein